LVDSWPVLVATYDFESLLDEVLKNRPELTREQMLDKIQEKKRSVGAGFLTDQGALFLIAGELGVPLRHMTSTDLTLKDIYVGANDITIVARVLAVYPISEFNKKEGGTGRYRRLGLFDKSNVTRLTIWDDNQEAIKADGVSVDTPIRVLNAYVRPGLDGKPNLNLGKRGKIEILTDEDLISRLTPLSKLVKGIAEIEDEQAVAAVRGVVSSPSRFSAFTRSDGSGGSLTQFELMDETGKSRIRVVIWNPVSIEAKAGQNVVVTNLRVKKSTNGERELHGDSGSVVQVVGSEQDGQSAKLIKVSGVKVSTGRVSLEVMALSKASVRDATMRDGSTVKKAELIIGDDTGEITLVGWGNSADRLAGIDVGRKIRVLGVARQASRMGMDVLELGEESTIEEVPD
jgi:ssDNA-binding replication factor A large subunit